MADLEILTVGAMVKTCWEVTAGTRPTSGYTQLIGVNTAPSIDKAPNVIDVSDITDKVSRYAAGRQEPEGDIAFTLNHREDVITAWNTLVTDAATNYPQGLRLWFEYWFPGATNSYFFAAEPLSLGTNGIEQNALDTIPAHAVFNEDGGWLTASV